jgi:hypothetical protein
MNADTSIAMWVCTDCMMLFANGENPPEATEEETAAWHAAIDASIPDGYRVACGGTHEVGCANVEWDDDGNYVSWIGSSDCQCETIDFTWRSCDTCHNSLPGGGAGHRHAITLMEVSR